MPEQSSNILDEIMVEVYRAIYAALESRLHLIGSVIDSEAGKHGTPVCVGVKKSDP